MPNLVVLGQIIRAYLRRSVEKSGSLASRLSRSLKVVGTDTDRSATNDFLLMIKSNVGLSYTVSEINGDVGSSGSHRRTISI